MNEAPRGRAGQAYLVGPTTSEGATGRGDPGVDGSRLQGHSGGPGVLVLGSWWGLTPELKGFVERLADQGFVALAPDLLNGRRPETATEAEFALAQSDTNATAALILSSVVALRSQTSDPDGPIAVVGFSMGASWALWLANRQPESVSRVVVYYGTQQMDFSRLAARVQGHFAEHDELVSPDDLVALESELFEGGHEPEFWHYPGTRHWFAEPDQPEYYDADAADLAWLRTLAFLQNLDFAG